jgi:uncharacterized membrane protein
MVFHEAGIPMSLNKSDLDAYRRAKRERALKIDLLIVILSLAAVIVMLMDHPVPRPGAPVFHRAQPEVKMPGKNQDPVLARAQR